MTPRGDIIGFDREARRTREKNGAATAISKDVGFCFLSFPCVKLLFPGGPTVGLIHSECPLLLFGGRKRRGEVVWKRGKKKKRGKPL